MAGKISKFCWLRRAWKSTWLVGPDVCDTRPRDRSTWYRQAGQLCQSALPAELLSDVHLCSLALPPLLADRRDFTHAVLTCASRPVSSLDLQETDTDSLLYCTVITVLDWTVPRSMRWRQSMTPDREHAATCQVNLCVPGSGGADRISAFLSSQF